MAAKRKGRGKGKKVSKKSKRLPVSLEGSSRAVNSLTLRLSDAPSTRVGLLPQSTEEKHEVDEGGDGHQASGKVFRNKEKVLVVSSRGIVSRYRHLMSDIRALLPHCKKDAKMPAEKGPQLTEAMNDLAEMRNCSACMYFEMRKHKDLYLWLAKSPAGPSVKFLVSGVHTMAELKLTGNHLRGSRPFLTYSPSFDRLPHLRLLKEMFTQAFNVPRGHRKSKPFYDHVLALVYLDNHIWFRNYQICAPGAEGASKIDSAVMENMTLVEVGPRFCLDPIKIFAGSFGGPTLFSNPTYVSPNQLRAKAKRAAGHKVQQKQQAKIQRPKEKRGVGMKQDKLSSIFANGQDE